MEVHLKIWMKNSLNNISNRCNQLKGAQEIKLHYIRYIWNQLNNKITILIQSKIIMFRKNLQIKGVKKKMYKICRINKISKI